MDRQNSKRQHEEQPEEQVSDGQIPQNLAVGSQPQAEESSSQLQQSEHPPSQQHRGFEPSAIFELSEDPENPPENRLFFEDSFRVCMEMKEFYSREYENMKLILQSESSSKIFALCINHLSHHLKTEEGANRLWKRLLDGEGISALFTSADRTAIRREHVESNAEGPDGDIADTSQRRIIPLTYKPSQQVICTPLDCQRVKLLVDMLLNEKPHVPSPCTEVDLMTSHIPTNSKLADLFAFDQSEFSKWIDKAKRPHGLLVIPYILFEESINLHKERTTFLHNFTLLVISALYHFGLVLLMGDSLSDSNLFPIEFENPADPHPDFMSKEVGLRNGSIIRLKSNNNRDEAYVRKTKSFQSNLAAHIRTKMQVWMQDRLEHYEILEGTALIEYERKVNEIVDIANNFLLVTMLTPFKSSDFILFPFPKDSLRPSADVLFSFGNDIYNAGLICEDRRSPVVNDTFFTRI